jgi:c-di-GMP-binding flagellar brake protein YcgR
MESTDTPTATTLDIAQSNDFDRYLVESATERLFILRAVMQRNELITAYFNQGRDFLLTSVLAVDGSQVILDFGTNEAANSKIQQTHKIIFVTSLDKVKTQFTADHIDKVRYEGRDAFRIKFPAALLKIQRREYYRLATPLGNPLKCTLDVAGRGPVELTVADISVGGVGISGPLGDFKPELGNVFPDGRIVLPEEGLIELDLEIRSVRDVTLRSGAKAWRFGCRFLDIAAPQQAAIQRYINRIDRERRARLGDG